MTTPGHAEIRASTSLSSDGRSSSRTSAASSGYSESNYLNMNRTDGINLQEIVTYPDGNMNNIVQFEMPYKDLMKYNNKQKSLIADTTDDIGIGSIPKHFSNPLFQTESTQSLPLGLDPESIADFNMAMSSSLESFIVEHLASFQQDSEEVYLTPTQALTKLKNISAHGGLWPQKMDMNISSEILSMTNNETKELIEAYPIAQINLCVTVTGDSVFESLIIFSTKSVRNKVGAIHLFQCPLDKAGVISEVVNRQREIQVSQEMTSSNDIPRVSNGSISSSDPESPSMGETRTEWNLHQRHAVARAVEAFQTKPDDDINAPSTLQSNQDGVAITTQSPRTTALQNAKIVRDVEILNKCIEEVENFVVMLKRINESRKQLQLKKSKGSRKKKVENILILQSQPPPEHRIFDIYQKFKHSLNLLGKLQMHVSNPNAPELTHYLFIPLGIIVKVTGVERARSVVEPLLTNIAVELLGNCLDTREYHFWQSLGPNWTLTKNAEPFKDRYFQPYSPVFIDGWIPPEVILPQQEAAAKSVARMQELSYVASSASPSSTTSHHVSGSSSKSRTNSSTSSTTTTHSGGSAQVVRTPSPKDNNNIDQRKKIVKNGEANSTTATIITTNPTTKKEPVPVPITRIEKRSGSGVDKTDSSAPRHNSFNGKPKVLFGIVVYDYMAHNNKELTIRAGEKVEIIDNTRRWWLVKNNQGEQGYVPSTVLEIPAADSPSVSPAPAPEIPAYSPRTTNGHDHFTGYDTNQNYVNHVQRSPPPSTIIIDNKIQQKSPSPSVPQPIRTTTPVIISVQLPDGRVSLTNSPIAIQQVDVSRTSPPVVEIQQQRSASPPYAVAKKQTVSTQLPSGESANAVISTDYSTNGYHKSTAVIRTQASPPTIQPEALVNNSMPPPPPPPPSVPPPPPAVNSEQNIVLRKKTSTGSNSSSGSGGIKRDDSANDLHHELKNRLSMHGNPDSTSGTPGPRPPLNRLDSSPGVQPAMPDVDAVDVFIPLYKSSTADDVSRWLGKLGFSQQTIDALKGRSALELFKVDKDDMVELIGQNEGLQLYEELQVQNGAKTRSKSGMTELQKALVKRVQKREGQQELARIDEPDSPKTSPVPTKRKPSTSRAKTNRTASATTPNIIKYTTPNMTTTIPNMTTTTPNTASSFTSTTTLTQQSNNIVESNQVVATQHTTNSQQPIPPPRLSSTTLTTSKPTFTTLATSVTTPTASVATTNEKTTTAVKTPLTTLTTFTTPPTKKTRTIPDKVDPTTSVKTPSSTVVATSSTVVATSSTAKTLTSTSNSQTNKTITPGTKATASTERNHQSPDDLGTKSSPPPVLTKPSQGKGNSNDQAAMIRNRKEELERLKRENPPVNRNPGSATFTSFSSPSAQS